MKTKRNPFMHGWRAALCLAAALLVGSVRAAGDDLRALLDLVRPDLRPVAEALEKGDDAAAGAALLAHWRARADAKAAWEKAKKRKPSDFDRKVADEALEHKFFSHAGYQPSLFYGKDIDWTYWPIKADELRFQLHRHKWFLPLLRLYAYTGDAKYYRAWREQWTDWDKKNPFPARTKADRENIRFAWRALEISDRLNTLPSQLALAVHAPDFTADDLTWFLRQIRRHGDLVWERRAERGNHLLFEMTRLLTAAERCPELKASATWRTNAIHTLKEELAKQVYPDGVQYELDLGYHISAMNLFRSAMDLAPEAFTQVERDKVGLMAAFAYDLFFPDGDHPLFSDTHDLRGRQRRLREAANAFPKAFDRPEFVSRAYPHGGFYVLREGSPETGSMVVLKAGPAAFWHNQPDNGTFSYWHAGRDFFPDSGSYVYGGADTKAARNAFRATKAHSTLTLDDKNNAPGSTCKAWKVTDRATTVTVETPAYPGLVHRRTLTLAKGGTLTVEDTAEGTATGTIAIRFCLGNGATPERLPDGSWRTRFADGNDIRLDFADAADWKAEIEKGWHSRLHNKKEPRPILKLSRAKDSAKSIHLTTTVTPLKDDK